MMCLWNDIHRFIVRMPWLLHYLCLLLPLAMSMVSVVDSGRRLPAIYWNSSNPMFLISNNDHVIDVNDDDQIEIVCPYYNPATTNEQDREYYTVYMVKKSEYNSCTIYNRTEAQLIVNCSEPTRQRIFTLVIKSFGGIPNMPDFESGKSYYFISTSTGRRRGLTNQVEGACVHDGMKMMLRVCCGTTRATQSRPTNRITTASPRRSRPPSVRTTPRTSRRTMPTPPPTTTTTPRRVRPATTLKPKRPDYDTKENEIKDKNGPGEKMPPVISDAKERNMGLINSTSKTTSCSQLSIVLLTIVQILFILCR